MTPRHPLEAEKQFERRHLIRVRLSRVSRTLQPLTLRQFPLVTFKILGGHLPPLLLTVPPLLYLLLLRLVTPSLYYLSLFTRVTERGEETGHVTKEG